MRLVTICPRSESRARKSWMGVQEVERLLRSWTGLYAGPGNWELGARTRRLCTELVVKAGGRIALQECPQL